MATNILARV